MSIHILDSDTINKIAAGEVVERPLSVVKELVENSIDAGATSISVEIQDGGKKLIRVTDNGSGISRDDIDNVFKRHATSKLMRAEDLFDIHSLGFRGEAMSSIASIANVTLNTKTAYDDLGISCSIIDGKNEKNEMGLSEGTSITVEDIFYNTPARYKFLKNAGTEGSYIVGFIERQAMVRSDISFKLTVNGKVKLQTSGSGDLKEVIYMVYGREIATNIVEVSCKEDGISFTGYIGRPMVSRGNRSFENYWINGRLISNDVIGNSMEEAYKGYIMPHNFPFTAISFEIDNSLIDVNVHPAKKELRLSDSERIASIITTVLKNAITKSNIIPNVHIDSKKEDRAESQPSSQMNIQADSTQKGVTSETKPDGLNIENAGNNRTQPATFAGPATGNLGKIIGEHTLGYALDKDGERLKTLNLGNDHKDNDQKKADSLFGELIQNAEHKHEARTGKALASENVDGFVFRKDDLPEFPEKNFIQQTIENVEESKPIRVIGQLFKTYWLIEHDNTFYIMDQHAAHEKILYERLMKQINSREVASQGLLMPFVINVDPVVESMLEDETIIDAFNSIGYEIELFGHSSIRVMSVPAILPKADYKQMIIDMLDSLSDTGSNMTPTLLMEKLASMSCKAAIKGNDAISFREAESLINELMTAENPYNCPHGRPTLISMSKYEIEKKFKRIV